MRHIRTSNGFIELFEELDNAIQRISGFRMGELYFRIQKDKVTFYLNDQENPWRNDVWTLNIPFEIDGETVTTPDEASAALQAIMGCCGGGGGGGDVEKEIEEIEESISELEGTMAEIEGSQAEILNTISGITEEIENMHWFGSRSAYDAIPVKNPNTIYFIYGEK